jgi:hypothetical protein
MMNTMTGEVLRIPDAAAELGVTTKDLYRFHDEGVVTFDAQLDGWPAISVEELERYRAVRDGIPS